MPFVQKDGLEYYQFEYLQAKGIRHGVFTRKGGSSPKPWHSLNLGGLVGDERQNILENRRRVFAALGLDIDSHFGAWLVHGIEILTPRQPKRLEEPFFRADGILVDSENISISMLFADCVPIYFYDAARHVGGIVHAGWQGTVKKIASKAVEKLQNQFHSNLNDIWAGIGPSIGPDHYEVKGDVIERIENAFHNRSGEFVQTREGNTYLDLWKANKAVLEEAGVRNIEIANCCTACDITRWYSHRQEKGKTGRFVGIFSLKRD